ncbi:MAG: TolC family protein [Candidatus Omnitrophica bacterium]|nr:TolC family protein [Candidatus Omnitrophota bacterium]MDD5592762.1 TolC family protein [Candidatus Omnitrophota bacterium]
MIQFSKNTLKLLRVFYARPQQQFYIQELGRMLRVKPGVFQRTLYKLEKQGVLQSSFKANARFFSANENYPLYKEFRAIVQKIANLIIIIAIFNFILAGSGPGFCDEQKSQALSLSSLKDAIKIAFKNNKDIRIQEYALKIADADILNARSEFLPKVDFNAGYTRNGAVLASSTSATKKDNGIFSGYKNDNTMGISINDTLYNGGANLAALREAQLALKEQRETLRATKLNVEFEAKRLYYGLLLAYETRRIAEDLVEQARSHYEEVKHNFKQGTSSRFDVLQSKVQVSLLMPQLINAQNSIDLIIAEMNKLLGLRISDKIIINDKLVYAPFEIKEVDFLKEAYLNEPEMILKSLGIDINKWAIKYAKAGWLPQVETSAEYSYRSNNYANMFNNKHNNWNIGLSVSVPIFDGFSTKAKVDAAKAKYMQAVIGKENLADQVAVDVRQACLDLVEASSLIKSQEDNLQDAKEALEISYVRYNNGVGINLDVLDAQVSLAKVEKNLSEGIYDYIMAQAKLDRVMGRGLVEEEK